MKRKEAKTSEIELQEKKQEIIQASLQIDAYL